VRYLVVAMTAASSFLLYLDRICISTAQPLIQEDLGLTSKQSGWMLSAFFWTYALAQVPSGFLGDRFGARRMLTLYILFWSLFSGLTGLAGSLAILLLFRFGCGLAQAGAYPTAGSLLSKWVTFQVRGFASSLVAWGGRIGGVAAPILTTILIVAFVPLSTSSLLKPEDILDYSSFCRRLHSAKAEGDAFGARIVEYMPLAARQEVLHVGALNQQALELYEEGGISLHAAREEVGVEKPTESEVQTLVAGLNQALRQPDLAETSSFAARSLPDQAQALLERPRAELNPAGVERLNRLLLEVAYPQEVRKVYLAGWRPVMWTYGLAGLIVAGLVWYWFRDRPALHPRCNQAEVDLIENSRPPGIPSPHGAARRVPVVRLLTSTSMWLNCLVQMGTNVGWVFLITWLPRYLTRVHHVPIERLGWLQATPLAVGCVGMLLGGWLTDRLTRSLGRRWGRALPLALSRFVAMSAFLVCTLGLNAYAVTAVLCVVAFATDLGTSCVWAYSQDVGGRHVGSVLGWGNMFGNIGAALSPLLLEEVIGPGNWDLAFLTCALAFLLSGLCALGVNASIPIVPPDKE
jgi:MFS family permease